jgi:hypothetical protein
MPLLLADPFDVVDDFDPELVGAGPSFEYLTRCRRVAVGPSVSLMFENAQTLAFRVREINGLSRQFAPAKLQKMREWYAGLLPGHDRLTAAVTVRLPGRRPGPGFCTLAESVAHGQIVLRVGDVEITGETLSQRAGDRVLGAAFWTSFHLTPEATMTLGDFTLPAFVSVISDDYVWDSEPLCFEMRQSLLQDLEHRKRGQ